MRAGLLILGALAALALAAPANADTLVENVNGVTLDETGKVVRFKALIFDREGKVVRLLNAPLPPAAPEKRRKKDKTPPAPVFQYRVDGKGATMLPGLIDAHGHVMGLGWSLLSLDLSASTSLEDALARIRAYAAANPQRRWIVGRGWNQERWGLGRFPSAAELDGAVSDRPVWLERVDGHAGWANSRALALAGVTAKTPSPAGGRIEMAAGKPAGVLVDAAMELVGKHVPPPLSKEYDLAFVKAQDALLAYGITGVADMGTSLDDWLALRRAGDRGALRLRVFSYSAGLDPMLAIAGGAPTPWLYRDRLRMAGVKLYADGALGSRGAWLKTPYADKPGERGLAFLDDTKLRNMMSRAAMDDFQLAVHAIGDAANAQLLDAVEELALTYGGDRRWRIEHAQVIDPRDIPRFARHGIIASMQPVHQTSDRTMAEARLDPPRLAGAYAWRSVLNAGGKLAFGSDFPVESPDPFAGLAVAISRRDANGQPPGGWRVEEAVSPEEALAGFTVNAAYAAFAEAKTGRLAPGLWADFILVDTDPLLATPEAIRKTRVLETWLGGERVFKQAP